MTEAAVMTVMTRNDTVYSLVAEALDEHGDLEDVEVAGLVLAQISANLRLTQAKDKLFIDWFSPLVTNLVSNARRAHTRKAEVEAFRRPRGRRKPPAGTRPVTLSGGAYEPDVAALRALVNEDFKLGRGRPKVLWFKATIAEHEEVIASLTANRDGIDHNIERHRFAISLIKDKPGATCLEDVLA